MIKHMLCTNCGYDMVGAEYISNTVDSSLCYGDGIYSNSALLNLNTKPYSQVVCPYCHSTGQWSS